MHCELQWPSATKLIKQMLVCLFSFFIGNVGVNELLSTLIEAVEVFTEHRKVEVREEQERAERELVKWEQDQAYRESLEADR